MGEILKSATRSEENLAEDVQGQGAEENV